jgi:CBS domain-containing protein
MNKCPTCGYQNLLGEDRCAQCFHSLMHREIPKHKQADKFHRIMMSDPISELVTGKDLLVASPTDTVQKIIQIMQNEKKDCVLIYKKKHLVGIISYRDLLRKVTSSGKDLSKLKAESIMTPNPEFVWAEHPIAFMVNKMAMGGFRHVPVLQDDGAPISIVSIKDVLSYLTKRPH